jgi:adenosylmethionine-8-amino-7-oxononanoate aminotransferase
MPTALLHPFAKPAKDGFINIVRGEGAMVFDDAGNAYIDGIASLWYSQIGHGRSDMADAIAEQVRTLEAYNCFDPYTNPRAEELAAAVVERSPHPDGRVFLTCSGSESVDSAIKLARLFHGLRGDPDRTRLISRDRGYHGVTYGGMSAQGLPANRVGWGRLLDGFDVVPQHDLGAVERLFAEHPGQIAAVLTEPVQGAGGVFPPEPGYLEGLRELCTQHGALLIFDEVVCAFGRLGTWFGAQHFGITPDLLTFAKGVTSGYLPLGGVVLSRVVCDALEADPDFILRHGFTYSGHPTACAAGLRNLRILDDEGLLERAVHVGARLEAGLRGLLADGLVQEVRGAVAVQAVRVNQGVSAADKRRELLDRGVIARPIGDALAFCPPLVITDEQIDTCVEALRAVLSR